jgi:glycosyltransferase involved in cell wall biosynthesis
VKNGLFITDINLYVNDALTNGIIKKINHQISALNIEGQLSCKSLVLPKPNSNPFFMVMLFLFFDIYKTIFIEILFQDFIYIRRISPTNYSLIKLLKKIKERNNNCKILYEIPTYPYDKEHRTIRTKVNLIIDKIFRKKLKKYVDKIITYSNDDKIYGISTIKIKNGIRCCDIPVRSSKKLSENINLIAVAQFALWHGYDRLIKGLNNYYMQSSSFNVYLHFIGDGKELNSYKKLVKQYNLSEFVLFHGLLFGDKLTEIFNNSDIAVCSLGVHRIGITLGSFLKSREYLARGIPMISSIKIDILPDDFEYCLYVPEDDSSVNICNIISYYKGLLKNQTLQEITCKIRTFAENNCDISKTMRPIIEYLK